MNYGFIKDNNGNKIYINDNSIYHEGKKLNDVINAKANTSDLINLIYPVGSIYMNVNSTNPAILFGGTWEQIKGRFLLGAGRVEANTNNFWGELSAGEVDSPLGELGGEAWHELTQSQIPNYSIGKIPAIVPINHVSWNNGGVHGSDLGKIPSNKTGIGITNGNTVQGGNNSIQYGWEIFTNGGGQTHNNMPPYLVVTIWKRIA